MHKHKKLMNLMMATIMVISMAITPVAAMALPPKPLSKPVLTKFVVTSAKKKQASLKTLTKNGKKKTKITIAAKYKNTKTYKVTSIKPKAFKGSKAKTIIIKANIKPAKAKNMLLGSKAKNKKVTIKVPAKQFKAWKKAAKKGVFGKGYKVTIRKI